LGLSAIPVVYEISNTKDVDGDGRIDVFCRLIEMPFSQVVRFDSSRKQVWMSE